MLLFVASAWILVEKEDRSTKVISVYSGEDWVAQEDFKTEIGTSFTSGTGVRYTVISEERNDDSGRMRIVLVSENSKKKMAVNLPNFMIDAETGIVYFNIYEYTRNLNYTKYK